MGLARRDKRLFNNHLHVSATPGEIQSPHSLFGSRKTEKPSPKQSAVAAKAATADREVEGTLGEQKKRPAATGRGCRTKQKTPAARGRCFRLKKIVVRF